MFKLLQKMRLRLWLFLVALPLCLGIALASELSPLRDDCGIIGGLIVAPISGSHVGVSGPAAGWRSSL